MKEIFKEKCCEASYHAICKDSEERETLIMQSKEISCRRDISETVAEDTEGGGGGLSPRGKASTSCCCRERQPEELEVRRGGHQTA